MKPKHLLIPVPVAVSAWVQHFLGAMLLDLYGPKYTNMADHLYSASAWTVAVSVVLGIAVPIVYAVKTEGRKLI